MSRALFLVGAGLLAYAATGALVGWWLDRVGRR